VAQEIYQLVSCRAASSSLTDGSPLSYLSHKSRRSKEWAMKFMINEIFAPSGLLKLLLLSVERKKESGRGKMDDLYHYCNSRTKHARLRFQTEMVFGQQWYLAS